MGAYKHIMKTFQAEYKERSQELKGRIVGWRRESSVQRLEKPTNIARARTLGYRAKPGVVVLRVRVRRGLRKREKPSRGRKPSKTGRFFAYEKSLQSIAEERASRYAINCEALNSYYVGSDGQYKFFEVILLDRDHPGIINSRYKDVIKKRGRAFRGLTSSGRKHRGLQ
jgi:large subunit ribosomal protein L15e